MLTVVLAIVPTVVTATVPIWVATAAIDVWSVVVPELGRSNRGALYFITWAMVISVTGLKYTIPLLAALAWVDGTRPGIASPAVWAMTVLMSAIVVVRGGAGILPVVDQLSGTAAFAIAVLWLCLEVVGSLAPAALLEWPLSAPTDVRDDRASLDDGEASAHHAPSASSALSADEIFDALREACARHPGLGKFGYVDADGALRTSHRQLAEAFRMPKNNVARRLNSLARARRITVTTHSRRTRIVIGGVQVGDNQ